ncbi:unnamed protein product (macronuclear) [Paramecium tetraurelia]|uniref:cathepsin L n=1 Tax=Paramecium tetraurelia TaxID=5888 RepID=A0BEB2_PARTE|nr:uncharacterized protein GSPATT00027912001 [Paramecium tetraurelia]CAK56879.1 unnamed protein product [Paramecium tetraurelia]|eukprot:XP_001424277.1 hypothetical protein (macronuclear) [Paramecium tetraurelia strain d4-2]
MYKPLIALITTVLFATTSYLGQEDPLRRLYQEWKQKYQTRYTSQFEDEYRFEIFKQNYNYYQEVNSRQSSYTLGINQFATLTDEEFEQIYLGRADSSPIEIDESIDSINLPESVDWSSKMNPVKNQGTCGSGWSFSAVGAFEAFFIFVKGTHFQYSEQNLVDCDTNSHGCDGGYPAKAIDYLNKNGAFLESEYPYVASKEKCRKTQGSTKANSRKTWTTATQAYEAIAQYPISVSVQSSNWKGYTGGIFSNCINTSTNHAAVAVGYDSKKNWLIRNSWGSDWGVNGHIWLAIGNTCGVLSRLDQVI